MKTDEEMIGNAEKLISNDQYEVIIAAHFPRFSLDLSLCSPSSLNLTKKQLIDLLRQVEESLPSHLLELPQLRVTLQACSRENVLNGHYYLGSIEIFSPHSTTAMVSYKATITPEDLHLGKIAQRSLSDIRKQSLQGEDTADELLSSFAASIPSRPIIFIVDDNMLIQKIITRILATIDESYAIRCFNDGNDIVTFFSGVNHSNGTPCSLILMDLQMPNLDGLEATKMIREYEDKFRLTPIPIIAITAQSDLSLDALLQAGFTGCASKPLTRDSLERVLEMNKLYVKPNPPIQAHETDPDENPEDSSVGCGFC